METLGAVFGQGTELSGLQAALRAIVVFGICLVLIRLSGRRSFGQRSPFDYVVAILLGATLSRAIVGASPIVATVSASLALVVIHRALAWLCMCSPRLERWIVGREREVYCNGRFDLQQMRAALVSDGDVQESVRQKLGMRDLSEVQSIILERNGRISLIRKRGET